MSVWFGLVARAGTPVSCVRQLHEQVVQATHRPGPTSRWADLGFSPLDMSTARFSSFIRTESQKWGAFVRESGIVAAWVFAATRGPPQLMRRRTQESRASAEKSGYQACQAPVLRNFGLRRLRLSARLSVGVVALVLTSTTFIATAALLMVKETVKASIANEQFARIASIGDAIDQKFASRRILLQSFGESVKAANAAEPVPLRSFLQAHKALTQAFFSVYVVNPAGALVASSAYPEHVGLNVASRHYFADTLKNRKGVVSQPFRNQISGIAQVVMTEPVFSEAGELLFVIIGSINLQERNFLGELADVQFGRTGYMFILNTDGIMIAHPQRSRILKPSDAAGGNNLASQRALSGQDGTLEAVSREGVAALYAHKHISQTNWIIGARYPCSEAFAPLRKIEEAASIGALCIALLAGSIALAVMRRQLRPIALLHEHMKAAHAAPVYLPMRTVFREDEIGDLARTLDQLLAQRQASADQQLSDGRFLRNLADSLPVLIAYIDAGERYRFVNSTFLSWTSANPATVIGQTMEEVIGAGRYAERLPHLKGALAGRRADFEILIEAPGAPQHVQTSYVPDLRPDGSVAGVYCLASDVTAQKQVQARLHEATHEAQKANLAKSQFLANMSHEIRTPMNAVIGLTYLLGQSVLDARQSDTVMKLRIAGKSLLRVINDVLDLSQIEAGDLVLDRAPFVLVDVIDDLQALMELQASAKSVAFSIHIPEKLPSTFEGDAIRLGQVLTNLVANAIKFTDRGTIELRVSSAAADAAPQPGGVARLRFEVQDSGIGIAPEVQARLFSPFTQADSSIRRRFGGTGLGLSIAARLVSMMGGRIGLESRPGVGSTFWFELDLTVIDPAALAPASAPALPSCNLRGLRILVTDDSDINLEVASRILLHHGALVTTSSDGQQAVDLLAQCPQAFDLVLMDVQMPVLDGYEATRQIRQRLGLHSLPVIALTAGALSNEHDDALAAGMNDLVRKPFEAQNLVDTVWRHARPPASLAGRDESAQAPKSTFEPAWPDIPGIDTADVRPRLGGDLVLFGSMLRRLLQEFSGVGRDLGAGTPPAAEGLTAVAARMHKLKGSAGTLGATVIARLADEAEAACRSGRADIALTAVQRLGAHIQQLGADAAPVLERFQTEASTRMATDVLPGTGDSQRLKEFVDLLETQSLSAIDCFRVLAPELLHRLGDKDFLSLQAQMENLQFADVLGVLEERLQGQAGFPA